MRGPQTDHSETTRTGHSQTPTPRRSWPRPRRRRAKFSVLGLAALGVTGGLLAASALAAPTPAPPSVSLKVLLIGSGSADPTTVAWESALSSEGLPYTEVTAANTGALGSWQVALPALTTGTQGNYNGVVIADSPSDFAAGQLSALYTYEGQFNVRQLDGYVTGFPSVPPNLGVTNDATGAAITATSESLTAAGTAALPGLAGSVPFDTGSYAYPATPLGGSAFTSWLSYSGATSLGGVYQHPSTDAQKNVQEAVLFFAYNQYQTQWHVLSRGLVDWVTQNAHLGLFRNYASLHLDDMFNSDNTWDIPSHTTSLTAAAQVTAADIAASAQWSRLNNFRIDWAYNAGASSANDNPATADPLLAQFQATDPATGKPYSQDFGWINHTWDHATLDQGCATTNYIEAELNQNSAFATASGSGGLGGLGLTADPNGTSNGYGSFDVHAFVPGEHSGLANLIPGATASIDAVDTTGAAGGSGGALAAGTYNYAVTAQYIANTGDSQTQTASVRVASGQTVSITWTGVCKAASYRVYRQNPGSATWNYITTVNPPAQPTLNPSSTTNTAGGGMAPVSYTDTGTAGTSTSFVPSLTATTALEFPYEQNQSFNTAIAAAGITAIGGDASKPYPNPPTTAFGINTTTPYSGGTFPAGQSFADGTARVVPRHPINVYYNVATWPQEIDEYNTIYPGTNSTQASITNQVESGMFSTITNNDPAPFYAHQTNLVGASSSSSVLIPVLTQFETQYHSVFSAAEPYVQPTLPQSALTAQRQQVWAAAVAAGTVTATEQGGTIVIKNTGGPIDIPINAPTGTLVEPGGTPFGSAYAGSVSDWVTVPAGGTYNLQAPAAPYVTTQPVSTGNIPAGGTATFTAAATNGQSNPPASVQWYVSTDNGLTWNPVAGATSTTLTLTGLTGSMNNSQYEAIFTNTLGSATSNPATLAVGQTVPTVPTVASPPNATSISYGQTLSSAILSGGSVTVPNGSGGTTSVPGTWSFATPSVQPGLGITNQQVVFTPNDTSSYTTVTTQVPVTVNKATLIVAPDAKTVTYASAAPSYTKTVTGFAKGETTSTAAGYVAPTCTSTYTATTAVSASPLTITCSGGAATDYVFSYSTALLTIVKATPTITRVPTASQIRFGQTLARSTLSRGSASVSGTFAWSNPTLVPPRGTSSQQVRFTPRDTVDYNVVTGILVNVQAN